MSIINNPLHKYASYNYRWRFGILGPGSIDNPEGYRENGPDITIIQSGGAEDKTITTYAEQRLGVNVEYYIDDFTSEYLVVPNPGTSFSNAIKFEFKVYEPLSVGLFFQTIKLAVTDAGYPSSQSYLDVPFLLELDFIGYDDQGNTLTGPDLGIAKHSLAIYLTNVTFNVDQSGATYTVTALPWNHQALIDNNQRIPTDIKIAGDTVEAMLHGSAVSLTSELNRIQENIESSQDGQPRARIASNRYHIVFPASAGGTNAPEILSIRDRARLVAESTERTLDRVDQINAGTYQRLTGEELLMAQPVVRTSSATSSADINYIGNSPIISDFEAYGTNPFGIEQFVFDEGSDEAGDEIYTRGTLTIDANTREFQWSIGTKIEKIISDVILASEWGLNLINQQPDSNGDVEWFKIHVESRIRSTEEMLNSGSPALDFYYIVAPFRIDASVFAASHADQSYTPKIADCVKSYQYLYTGLNSDIINFEINIDNAFYREAFRSNEGNIDNSANAGSGVTTGPVDAHFARNGINTGDNVNINATTQITSVGGETSGSGARTSRKEVADLFARAVLNSDIDMVQLDLKIWGDPYYFMDTDVGNYRSPSGNNPNITFDGKINPTDNEVYILIQFKSAVDYNGNLLQMDPVNLFSGIYKVVTFTNEFSNGMFTQNLQLLRMPNQETESVEASNSLVEANTIGNLPLVLSNLRTESANRLAEFESLITQAEDFQRLQTAFANAGIQNFENILNGSQIFDLAQNLSGAFNQLANLQNNLSTTLNALQGGLPNLLESAARNALSRTPIGQTVNRVTRISSDLRSISNNLRNL